MPVEKLPVISSEVERSSSSEVDGSEHQGLNEQGGDLKESHIRSLLKAFSWRILATLTTALIAYFVTGEIDLALMIGGIEFVLKFVIYYLHERAWQLAPRGSVRRALGQESP